MHVIFHHTSPMFYHPVWAWHVRHPNSTKVLEITKVELIHKMLTNREMSAHAKSNRRLNLVNEGSQSGRAGACLACACVLHGRVSVSVKFGRLVPVVVTVLWVNPLYQFCFLVVRLPLADSPFLCPGPGSQVWPSCKPFTSSPILFCAKGDSDQFSSRAADGNQGDPWHRD